MPEGMGVSGIRGLECRRRAGLRGIRGLRCRRRAVLEVLISDRTSGGAEVCGGLRPTHKFS